MDTEPNVSFIFRRNMRDVRAKREMSQGDLAKRIDNPSSPLAHQTTIARIENGTRGIKLDEAHELARALGVTVSSLIEPSTKAAWAYTIISTHLNDTVHARDKLRRAASAYETEQQGLRDGLAVVEGDITKDELQESTLQADLESAWRFACALIEESPSQAVEPDASNPFLLRGDPANE